MFLILYHIRRNKFYTKKGFWKRYSEKHYKLNYGTVKWKYFFKIDFGENQIFDYNIDFNDKQINLTDTKNRIFFWTFWISIKSMIRHVHLNGRLIFAMTTNICLLIIKTLCTSIYFTGWWFIMAHDARCGCNRKSIMQNARKKWWFVSILFMCW